LESEKWRRDLLFERIILALTSSLCPSHLSPECDTGYLTSRKQLTKKKYGTLGNGE